MPANVWRRLVDILPRHGCVNNFIKIWRVRPEVGCMYAPFSLLNDRVYGDGVVSTGGSISSFDLIIRYCIYHATQQAVSCRILSDC